MFRLLRQWMFGKRREGERTPHKDPSEERTVWPFGKTDLREVEAAGVRRPRRQKQFTRKGGGREGPQEPKEKPMEKSSGGESVSMGKCPVCGLSVKIDTPQCPKCGTRFCRRLSGRNVM